MMEQNKDAIFEKLMHAYIAGKLSDEDAKRLCQLLESDAYYQELYSNTAKFHATSAIPKFAAVKQANYKTLTDKIGIEKGKRPLLTLMQMHWQLAAAVLIGFTIGVFFVYFKETPIAGGEANTFSTVSVPAGGKTKIVLPDQSVVWLNATSTLTYATNFSGERRDVYLEGEGYFDVQPDEDRPFIVHAQDVTVAVLGTTFNINTYQGDHDVEVSLIEGSVNIAMPNGDEVPLKPNQQLRYRKSGSQWEKVETIAARSAWWTSGKLYFDNASMADIMKTLERRFDVSITVKSDRMDEERFSGSVDPELNVMEILQYLDVDGKYTLHIKGRTIVISDR